MQIERISNKISIEDMRIAAEQGDAAAQCYLGIAYSKGEGIEKNYKRAVEWWLKAAQQGHAPSQVMLGFAYANGEGVERDCKQAVEWFRRADE